VASQKYTYSAFRTIKTKVNFKVN